MVDPFWNMGKKKAIVVKKIFTLHHVYFDCEAFSEILRALTVSVFW